MSSQLALDAADLYRSCDAHSAERGPRGKDQRLRPSSLTVHQSLHHKRLLTLDLSLLLAGSGIRGQFEERFKALLKDIEDEHGDVICFIDELREWLQRDEHYADATDTLLNLGKAEGSMDAGNVRQAPTGVDSTDHSKMIKPALARGLQLVGATTCQYNLQQSR